MSGILDLMISLFYYWLENYDKSVVIIINVNKYKRDIKSAELQICFNLSSTFIQLDTMSKLSQRM